MTATQYLDIKMDFSENLYFYRVVLVKMTSIRQGISIREDINEELLQ